MDLKNTNLQVYRSEYVQKIEDTKRKIKDAEVVLARKEAGNDLLHPSKGFLAQQAKVEKLKKHLNNQIKELQKLDKKIAQEEAARSLPDDAKPENSVRATKGDDGPPKVEESPPPEKEQAELQENAVSEDAEREDSPGKKSKRKKKKKQQKDAASQLEEIYAPATRKNIETADTRVVDVNAIRNAIAQQNQLINSAQTNKSAAKTQIQVKEKEAPKKKEEKPKEHRPAVFWLILIGLIALCGYSGYKLYTGIHNYREAKRTYTEIAELAVVTQPKAEGFTESMVVDNPVLEITGETSEEAREASIYQSLDVPQVDFSALLSQDKNVVGWISVPALNLGYPVMATDNNEYYLHKTLGGKDLYAGSIFMDHKNKTDFSDPNTFIYGHNMKNGTMFGALNDLSKQEIYDTFPAFWIITPDGTAKLYHIFSMHKVITESETYKLFTDHGPLLKNWAIQQQSESIIKTDDVLNENSKIITLSTCTSDGTPQDRFVVQGTLVYETKTN